MNDFIKFRKSKLLLLTLLALIVGGSPAWAQKTLPYEYGFENNDLTTEGWTMVDCTTGYNGTKITSDAKMNGSYGFMFWYNSNPPQYLISPELATSSQDIDVSIWYKNGSSYTETFNIGYSTSNETSSFIWLESDITAPSSWTEFKQTFPAGTKYIAIKYTANNQYKLYFDDFCVTEVEAYPKPKDFTFTGYTTTSATFNWTNGGEETAWQIAYSTTQGFNADDVTPVDVAAKPYTLEGLTAETTYYARIRANYGSGNYSKWSDEISFKPTAAELFIVNDGTATSEQLPIWGYNIDGSTKIQFIIPASSLENIVGGTISKMTFHCADNYAIGTPTFKIYLKEVEAESFESNTYEDWAGMTEVYDGTIAISDNQMTISFANEFIYNGGNLMVGLNQTSKGSYVKTYFYGVATSANTGISGYSGYYGDTKNLYQFLPKTTFTCLVSNSPKMSVVKNSSYDFGFLTATSEASAKTSTFTVKNIGKVELTDANVSYSGSDAISLSNTGTLASIDAKSSTDITITVNTETPGSYAGTITITGTGSDEVTIPVKAIVRNTDKLFVDFDATNPKPSAWTLGDGWSVNANGYATIGSTAAAITTSEILSAGETVTLRYRGNNASATLAVSYCATVDGEYTACTETVSSISTEAWQTATFTIPAVGKFVKITGQYLDLDAVYGLQAPAVPVMVLSATEHAFGLVSDAEAQAFTFTIHNEGGAALNNLSVTSDNAAFVITDAEGNALPTSIAAGNTITVKVKMNATGSQNGTITVSGTGVENQTVTVSGYMLDTTKICETFASKPDRWESTGSWSYSTTNGAYGTYSGATLVSPKIKVSEGEKLTISAKSAYSGDSYYIKVEGSADNGSTWTAFEAKQYSTASTPALSTTDFTIITIEDIPTTVNKLRITAYYAYINVFNGFTYAADPVLGLYSDEGCTTAQAATAEKNFGFVDEAQSQKYYIKNTGTGQIDLTITQADGFTAEVADAALAAGESTALTITMPVAEGLHNGTVTVVARNHDTDDELGTFAVTLNGASGGSKNDINFANLTELPAGWETEKWTVTANQYVANSNYNEYDLTSQQFTVGEGETLLIEVKGTSSYSAPALSYSYKAGDAEWTEAVALEGLSKSDWKVFAITGIPEGQAYVKFTGYYAAIRRIYGFEAATVPYMVFSASDKDFGMITSATTTDAYTIQNTGAGVLSNLSVTCDNENFTIAVADDATSIAASSSVTFTVTMKADVQGAQSGTITVAGDDVESKTFSVSGYVADGSKIFETMAAVPTNWENSGWSFSAANGAYSSSSSNTLTSPKITVAEGEKLAISAKLQYSSTYYYVTVEGSEDNGSTWTYSKKLSNDVLNKDNYTVVVIDDIPTTVNKLRLIGYYAYVNGLNGFTYNDNDPRLGIFSDSEFASEITTGTATNAWGFVSEAQTATYYIKNTGTGTMTLTKTDAPAGLTATLGATSLGAGESTTLTISMAATDNYGYHAGDVVLTATDDSEASLGTFTVTSSGVVLDPSKTDIDFTTLSAFPAGWDGGTYWSVTANEKATISYYTGDLTTGAYKVSNGDNLIIVGKGNSSYSAPTFTYQYSTDGGSNWTTGTSTLDFAYSSSYQLKAITDIPAAEEVIIKFTGKYMDIQRIYGYTAVAKPVMALDKADDYDFGMQTDAAEYVITVTNTGTAEMTGLAAVLTRGEESDYTVAVSKTTLAVNEEATITVTQKYDASKGLASISDVLTISADNLSSKVINLSGQTRDASKWYVDFADGTIPASFVEKGSWTAASQYAYTSSTSSLVSQPITLAAGEKIQFDARMPYSGGTLKTRYSTDGGITWSDYADVELTSEYATNYIDLGNTESVTALIEFQGYYYAYLDNIFGGTLNDEAPAISVAKNSTKVETGATEAFGSILTETTATYTITNMGNGTLTITSPVAVTGSATAAVDNTSLTAGQSATLTITMPVAAPYGAKEGAVTVETSLGDFVINYTATTMNPNALNVDFANNSKPAGWYFGGNWEVSNKQAQNTASGAADLISQKLTVAGTDDALTFQVAKTGSSAATFSVYTSTDRVNWTEVELGELTLTTDYQDVTIKDLASGYYYLKLTGSRVKVDNFLGWTMATGIEHDLYVTATSYPATQQPAAEASVTATVTSLIAAETGVYAKLFIDDKLAATAEAADVALNDTKTFTMTCTMPTAAGAHNAQVKIYFSDDTEAFATAVTNLNVYQVLDETATPDFAEGSFDIYLNRTFVDGWNTICLPFAVADIEDVFGYGAVAYAFTGYEAEALNFETVTSFEAGKPYVIYLSSGSSLSALTFSNATIATTATVGVTFNDASFKGSFAPMAAGTMTGLYGVTKQAKIAKGTASASMKGYRAYFQLPDGAQVKELRFNDVTTGLRVVETDSEAANQIFDLNGRKMNEARKGVFVVNGKKILMK